MKLRAGFVFLLILAAGCSSKKDGDGQKDTEKMQGTWSVTEFVKEGEKAEAEESASVVVVIKEDILTVCMEGKEKEETLHFKLDPSKKPRQIDFDDGKSSRKKDGGKGEATQYEVPGIYELDGDTLKICWNKDDETKRPTEFTPTEKNKWSMMTLKRKDK